jgi:Zn-dependent M28 family amino/carboxypeptidase
MRRFAVTTICALLITSSMLAFRMRSEAQAPGIPTTIPAINAGLPPEAEAAMNSIEPERLRAHTKFLSDDLLEGRYPGGRGGDIAMEYMNTQFALTGLQPGGDDGTYKQKIAMVFMKALPASNLTLIPDKGDPIPLKLNEDMIVQNETQTETADVDAPLVFVGYGIDAPEFGWNDYKDVDVRGKVVLVFAGEPPQTLSPTKGLNWYYKWSYKWDEAASKGAIGAIIINRQDMSSAPWSWLQNTHGNGRTYLKYGQTAKVKAAAWVPWELANKMVGYAGKNLDDLLASAKTPEFRPIALPITFKAHIVSQVHRFTTDNVVAFVPGSDPKLKNEAIVYTGHWDHLGIVPEKSGDNIYNGARDNATGSASMIELARAWSMMPVHPARTIILVSTAAEEQGMIGAEYYSQHPTFPGKIVLDLNYDGQAPSGDALEVRAGGVERTTFADQAAQLAKRFDMSLMPAPGAGAGCCRSDTFWMNSVGIPAFSMGPAGFTGHPAEWIAEQARIGKDCYHEPCDEYHADWDFRGAARVARYGFALAWEVANDPKFDWLPGAEYSSDRKKPMFCAPEHMCP